MSRLVGSLIWLTSLTGLGFLLYSVTAQNDNKFKDLPSYSSRGMSDSQKKTEQIFEVLKRSAGSK